MMSFAGDKIADMFSKTDDACMQGHGVALKDYGYMGDAAGDGDYPDHANARHVLARVQGVETPRMPLGAPPWDAAKIAKLKAWIDDGCRA